MAVNLGARVWWDAQVGTLGVDVVLADGTATRGLLSREILDELEAPTVGARSGRDRLKLWGDEVVTDQDIITVAGVRYLVNGIEPVTPRNRLRLYLQRIGAGD